MRLNKFLATFAGVSRRKADTLILEGKVMVNNKPAKIGQIIDQQIDEIKLENQVIKPFSEKVYYLLNKPKGYVCTRSRQFQQKIVTDLIDEGQKIFPIGRLDKDSTGLIILTNDGNLTNILTHPKHGHEKEYFVEALTPESDNFKIIQEKINKLSRGVIIDNYQTEPVKIKLVKSISGQLNLKIILKEGRNRQIRKMLQKVNWTVKNLTRIRINNLTIGNLSQGQYKKVNLKQIIS